jgi:uncharacterized protein YciI
MKKFIAIFDVESDMPVEKDLLLRHIEHLKKLKKKDVLFLCGPLKNTKKILQILVADDYAAAEQYAWQDPFASAGYFSGFVLYELIESNEDNDYLQKKG